MKSRFKEYYPLEEIELKELWSNAIFVFDTNVLFNFYRYSKETSDKFIETISKLKSRVWLPHQVAKEFHKKRLSIISTEIEIYNDFNKKIISLYEDFENQNRNPFLSKELNVLFIDLKNKITKEMEDRKKEYEEKIFKDDILICLSEIFENKISEDYNEVKIAQIKKEGEDRYKNNIPPGYEDKKKSELEKFGDLIIWYQMIDIANEVKKPIIYVTDDRKEDWWLIQSGKTISPRPELIKEFRNVTGQNCHFYKPFQFLKFSNFYLGNDINKDVIEEVQVLSSHQAKLDVNETRVEIIIKFNQLKSDLIRFVKVVEDAGYHCSYNEIDANMFQILLYLPNIPDLERRFKEKYLSLLVEYKLQLIDYKKL